MDSIIARSIAPLVAVISSPDVDSICAKNGLSDLAHLLRPWAASVERGELISPTISNVQLVD
jgi:hypothetical protein